MSPRQATYFSLLRQREVGKRKATPMPAPPACGGRCPAVLEERAQAQNSPRSLRSLRSDSCAKSEHEARCARGPALLCSSAWHRGGPEQPSSQQPNTEQPGLTRLRRFPAVGCSAAAPMRCREAQLGWAARASAHSIHVRPNCLNGVSEANAVSFGPAQPSEHRRGRLGEAEGLRIGAVFFAYFLARARK